MKELIAILIVVLLVFGWLLYDSGREYDKLVARRGFSEVGRTEMKETGLIDSINAPKTIRVGHDAIAREYTPYVPLYKKSICSECDRAICEMCAHGKIKNPRACRMCGRHGKDPPCPYCSSDRKFEAFMPEEPERYNPTPSYLRGIDDVSLNYFKR